MSVSILLEPQYWQPTYNEIITVLDSTQKTEPKFQFIIDINVNGSFSSKLKVSPNPDGYGVVDLHKHLESSISYDLDRADTKTFKQITNSFCYYDVTLYEEYIVTFSGSVITDNGGNTQIQNSIPHKLNIGDKIVVSGSTVGAYNGVHTVTSIVSTTSVKTNFTYSSNALANYIIQDGRTTIVDSPTVFSAVKYATNSVLNWVDVPNFNAENTYRLQNNTSKFISNIPLVNTVRLEDEVYINFWNRDTDDGKYLYVVSDNGTYTIENSYNTTSNVNKFLTVGAGANNILNTTDTVSVLTGSLPIIDSNTTSYSITIQNAGFLDMSETITFNIDNTCNNFEIYRLMYLDELGSFLNVNFELDTKLDMDVKKVEYLQHYGGYNSMANTYGWNSYDRGRSRLDTEVTEVYTVNSNWLSTAQSLQVKELVKSPEVYHLGEDGVLRAIDILTTSINVKNVTRDKVFNYSLKFQYSNKNTVQRG